MVRAGADEFSFDRMQEFLAAKGVAKQYWPEQLEVLDGFPTHPERKDPEVPAPQAGVVVTDACLAGRVRTAFCRWGVLGAVGPDSLAAGASLQEEA